MRIETWGVADNVMQPSHSSVWLEETINLKCRISSQLGTYFSITSNYNNATIKYRRNQPCRT